MRRALFFLSSLLLLGGVSFAQTTDDQGNPMVGANFFRILGVAPAATNPVPARLTDGSAFYLPALDTTILARFPSGSTPADNESNGVSITRSGAFVFVFDGSTWDRWTGAITANAGTNLNTSALALESSLVKLTQTQGSTTSGQSGPLIQAAVTTGAPTYTTGQTSPLSLDTAGALRVSGGGGGTQYAEDTAHVTGDTVTLAGVVQQSADTALSGDGDRSLLQVDASGFLKVNIKAGAGSGGTAAVDNSVFTGGTTNVTPMGAIFDATPPTITDGNVGAPRMTSTRVLMVDGSATTQPVSGTVTANAGSGTFAVSGTVTANAGTGTFTTDTELPAAAALADNQANPTAPATGAFLQAWDGTNWDRVQTGAATGGALKVDGSAVTQPVSGTVTANAGTNLNTSALALEAGGNLAAVSTSLSVLDDWDETDRAKVNPIAGQAGVQGGAGTVTALTQRVAIATDANVVVSKPVVASGDLAALNAAVTLTLGGHSGVGVVWTTTNFDGVLTPEWSADGTIWVPSRFVGITGAGATLTYTGFSVTQGFGIDIPGAATDARVRVSTYTAGTMSVTMVTTLAPSLNLIGNAGSAGAVNIQDGGNSITVDGTVTANAGTNLNTSALALETSLAKLTQAQASTTSGQSGPLIQGAVTTGAPTYTTGQTSPFSLDTAGALRVSGGGGGTQYAEDTAHVTGDTLTLAGVVQQSADAALSGDGDRSLLQVDASGFLKVNIKAGAGSGGTAATDNSVFTGGTTNVTPMGAIFDATPPTITDGNVGAPRMTSTRVLMVDGSATTQPVSGTVTVTDGSGALNVIVDSSALPTGASTLAEQQTQTTALQLIDNLPVAQASTTAGQSGALVQGAVTTAAPTYTTAQTSPLSLTTAGGLRVDGSGATQPISGTVTANAGTGTFVVGDGAGALNVIVDSGTTAVTQATASSLNAEVQGDAASGAAKSGNPVQIGAVFNTTQPTVTTGQAVEGQATARGALIVASGVDAIAVDTTSADQVTALLSQTGSNNDVDVLTLPSVTVGTFPDNEPFNLAQVAGTATVTGGVAGSQGVGGLAASGAAKAGSPVQIGGVFNTTQPTVTTGQAVEAQSTARGAQIVATGADTFNVTVNAALPTGANTIGALTANQSVNVAQINGVAPTMGNGVSGTGVQRVTIASDSTGTIIATQATAANLNARTDNSGATGAAPPARADYIGGLASGATGGFLTGFAVCDSFVNVNVSTATTTLLVTGVSGRHVRICSMSLVAAGADNVALISGTGATCGTGTTGMNGGTTAATGWNFLAGSGVTQGSGLGAINQTNATGDSVCVVTSAATQLSGRLAYSIY